jgi:hypothetical protein
MRSSISALVAAFVKANRPHAASKDHMQSGDVSAFRSVSVLLLEIPAILPKGNIFPPEAQF